MARKTSLSDTHKLVSQYRQERDEAVQREKALKEKLRQYETRTKSTEALKQKLNTTTLENKELKRQVKTLRTEIGLESSPKFQGKTTKDIVKDLQEKQRECNKLVEKIVRLNLTIDELAGELANMVTSKTLLEEKVQSLQLSLKDVTISQRRLLNLWDNVRLQREPVQLPIIPQRAAQKPTRHKAAQTDMSISSTQILPPNTFKLKWVPDRHHNLEGQNITLPNGYHRDTPTSVQTETKTLMQNLHIA